MLRTAFIAAGKTTIVNFKFLIISILITVSLVGSAFAQQTLELQYKEFTEEEIDKMKNTAVVLTTHTGTMMIEFYPEAAPNTVDNFLKLVERGYYDGLVFHRIIPGFMIQTGDPNTKDPEYDRSLWGQGGPGYNIVEEFNTFQHDRGAVSMARQTDKDSAGSQFFIVHRDSNFLDGQYTVFGRLVPGIGGYSVLDDIARSGTDNKDAPIDLLTTTIIKAEILYPFTSAGLGELDRNQSIIKELPTAFILQEKRGDLTDVLFYQNDFHDVIFHIPYRWDVTEGDGSFLDVEMQPGAREHNVQQQIDRSGFIPLVLVGSEARNDYELENDEISTGFFSIAAGGDHTILNNYIFQNMEGQKAHLVMSTQDVQIDEETIKFKILQLHFNNAETNYSIIYVNLADYFRYEVNAFSYTVDNFEIMIDGEMQKLKFGVSPVFQQLMKDAKEKPEPESLPPARIGGCLIATASYGSELAPQVQLLREIRDNTVLQTQSGASFMSAFNQFYYSFSPTIADYERENPIFKETVKFTLTPLLTSLTMLQYADINSEHEMLGYGIGVILLNIGMYFIAPAILIMKIRSFYKLQ